MSALITRSCGNCTWWHKVFRTDHPILGQVVRENWCTRISGNREPEDAICGDPRANKVNTAFEPLLRGKGQIPGFSFAVVGPNSGLLSEALCGWDGPAPPVIAVPVEEEDWWDDDPMIDIGDLDPSLPLI